MTKSKLTYRSRKTNKRNLKKSKRSRRSRSSKKNTQSRKKILRLIRNKSGGGSGWAPWVGAQAIHDINSSGENLSALEQPFVRSNGCQLISCMGTF